MRRGIIICPFIITALALIMITIIAIVNQPDSAAENKNLILLKNITINPAEKRFALFKEKYLQADQIPDQGYYIVQFPGPVQQSWKDKVRSLGAEIHDYIPNNAFLVKMDRRVLIKVLDLKEIKWIGEYLPDYRISPDLKEKIKAGDLITLFVQLFNGENLSHKISDLEALGAKILAVNDGKSHEKIKLTIEADKIPAIADIPGVLWIEEFVEPKLLNDVATGIMGANNVWSSGYSGSGQVVTVADTGLDIGVNDASIHDDVEGRITNAYALGRLGDWSDPNGHGTHVCCSVLGNGAMSGNQFRGTAWQANLVIQSIMDASGALGGIPANLNDLFLPPYTNDNSRIHTNSWGAPVAGSYTTNAQEVDEFVWNHPDMVILFSAGNEGVDANNDGVVDPDSIGSPATAKNDITVGASENVRSGNSFTYGSAWPGDFPAEPIFSDLVADNAIGSVAFSSRGPTDDGRIQPDVVAPGTNIISCRSHHPSAGTGWGVYDANYVYMGGTSMATPLVAGAAAVIRNYYATAQGLSFISAALVKATMINGAFNMSPGQYGLGATRDVPDPPDNVQGWGRVNLSDSLIPANFIGFLDHTTGLTTGQEFSSNFSISASTINAVTPGTVLRVTLVWSDYPSTPTAAINLVNDLDLSVTAPDSTVYYPRGGIFIDALNNVESINVRNPTAGTYTVRVKGTNVPNGPQPFALVVSLVDTSYITIQAASPPLLKPKPHIFIKKPSRLIMERQ